MSEIRLKKQINELRSSLFEKKIAKIKKNLKPANVNSNENPKATGIFNDVRSMDNRLLNLKKHSIIMHMILLKYLLVFTEYKNFRKIN